MNSNEKIVAKKSIEINMVLNVVKGLMGVIFPLITFPYISRILGVDNIGRYNFASSIISYFILIAGLGINTYAIRTGAGLREDKIALKKFADQIFTINILSTCISYILLGIFMIVIEKFHDYTHLLLILSLQIVFKTIGIEWIYSIYEDYAYITKRSIFFQIVSLLLMFLFVKEQNDINVYAMIVVVSSVGSNILNFFHAKKYCQISITLEPNMKKHLKEIIIFFATTLTVTIYVSSDTTILGFLCSDYYVGIYSVSVKIYTILKSILSAAIVVSIPRMSALWRKGNKKEFRKLGEDVYKIFLTFIVPTIFGVILLSKDIIIMISGREYLQAQSSLMLLSIALFFCLGAGFWSQGILIPKNQEKAVFYITIVSAILNIILNIILIPFIEERAAALTTIIAEGVVFLYCRHKANNAIEMNGIYKLLLKIVVGCVPMIFFSYLVNRVISNIFFRLFVMVVVCVIEYCGMEIFLKNEVIEKIYIKTKICLKRVIVKSDALS